VLNCCMGTLYTWPIFLTAYESLLQLQRSQLSVLPSNIQNIVTRISVRRAALQRQLTRPFRHERPRIYPYGAGVVRSWCFPPPWACSRW
jgi:hypothetical protein